MASPLPPPGVAPGQTNSATTSISTTISNPTTSINPVSPKVPPTSSSPAPQHGPNVTAIPVGYPTAGSSPIPISPPASAASPPLPPTPTPETSITLTSSSIAAAVQVPSVSPFSSPVNPAVPPLPATSTMTQSLATPSVTTPILPTTSTSTSSLTFSTSSFSSTTSTPPAFIASTDTSSLEMPSTSSIPDVPLKISSTRTAASTISTSDTTSFAGAGLLLNSSSDDADLSSTDISPSSTYTKTSSASSSYTKTSSSSSINTTRSSSTIYTPSDVALIDSSTSSDEEANPSSTDSSAYTSSMSYTSDGVTLTGEAAAAALAAAATNMSSVPSGSPADTNGSSTTESGGSKLGSFAIVGIGGILVFFVLVYLAWYRWRKKRTQASLDDDLRDPDGQNKGEKNRKDDTHSMHSGFDFIDESPVRRRHQSQSQDPFDDPRRTEYGETWYQDPHDDNFTEYLDDERTSQYLNDRHRLTDFSAINGPTERFSRLDDGMTTAFGDNLKTGASGLTANIRNSGGSANTFAPPVPPSRGTPFSVYEDGMTATSGDHLQTADTSRMSRTNPYAAPVPPVPPIPTGYADPTGAASRSRPETSFSQAESFDYPRIYGGYDAPSRPGTQHAPPTATPSSCSETPATSNLFPWLNRGPTDPVPPVLQMPPDARAQWSSPRAAEPDRPPPVPAMARTPMAGHGDGWQGVIPQFR